MKILSVVGARPQFIKAGPVSRAARRAHSEVLVHTGQHYDSEMSAVFFEQLGIPAPDVNLEVGSGSHAQQTGLAMTRLEPILVREQPDVVLVYGDTNSTLAGALAAAQLHIPVAHVEAGLRSFNRAMPEELNRIVADRCSDLLFCPGELAAENLRREGMTQGVHVVGDVMLDALLAAAERSRVTSDVLERLGLERGSYLLATIHRAENTADPRRLRGILDGLAAVEETVIFPVHPRTRKLLERLHYVPPESIRIVRPVDYLDMVALLGAARLVVTDSGGLQKEAYWLRVPCVTAREETEWTETVAAGWNRLVGSDPLLLAEAVASAEAPPSHPTLYGEPGCAERIVAILEQETAA